MKTLYCSVLKRTLERLSSRDSRQEPKSIHTHQIFHLNPTRQYFYKPGICIFEPLRFHDAIAFHFGVFNTNSEEIFILTNFLDNGKSVHLAVLAVNLLGLKLFFGGKNTEIKEEVEIKFLEKMLQ